MKLSLEQIRDFQVPAGSLGLWWLGQAGFIIKSPSGVVAALDAYLSDSCGPLAKGIGFDFSRLYSPPMEAGELAGVDVYMLSHSHQDHLDPDTIATYRACGGRGPYVAPHYAAAKLAALGVEENEIIRTWPGNCVCFKDFEIRTTFAVPFGDDDLTHVGYVVCVSGVSIYFTGDTAYHEAVGISASAHKPDIMVAVINGAFRNLTAADAARLAHQIQPRTVIPCHHDLFVDGRVDPQSLRLNLFVYGMAERFKSLEVGKGYVF